MRRRMTRVTKEWRKKIVRPRMTRMRRTWNSWEMDWVERARPRSAEGRVSLRGIWMG